MSYMCSCALTCTCNGYIRMCLYLSIVNLCTYISVQPALKRYQGEYFISDCKNYLEC